MRTLKANKIASFRGFNFHLPSGYPEPSADELRKAWNNSVNGQMDNYTHRNSVARNFGTEVKMKCIWIARNTYRWQVEEIFFKSKP